MRIFCFTISLALLGVTHWQPEDSLPPSRFEATYCYAAANPSLDKVADWVQLTFKHTQPVALPEALLVPFCFSAGRKKGVIHGTLSVTIQKDGYKYAISNLCHQGNGWIEDLLQLEQMAPVIELELLQVRHSFEQWLLTAEGVSLSVDNQSRN